MKANQKPVPGVGKGPDAPPTTTLEEKQDLLRHHVRMLARGMSLGLFVAGSGGLGKSKIVAETLAGEGIVPVLANSHVTPLALYGLLYHHREGQVIWLDDADTLYTNMVVLGLLRSALWGGQRGADGDVPVVAVGRAAAELRVLLADRLHVEQFP